MQFVKSLVVEQGVEVRISLTLKTNWCPSFLVTIQKKKLRLDLFIYFLGYIFFYNKLEFVTKLDFLFLFLYFFCLFLYFYFCLQ
jgi:hypothetical protein